MTFPVYNRGLVYHKVSEKFEWGLTTTTPKQFRTQMLELQRLGFSFSRVRDHDPKKDEILVTFDDGYSSVNEYAVPILDEVGGVATTFVITNYVGKKNSWDYFPEDKQVTHMDWSQLRTLHEKGWEIGSHGRSHKRLVTMDKKKVEEELILSRKEIEDRLGCDVPTFCPPFNAWNADLLDQIEQAGYTKVAISFPLSGLPKWGGEFVPRLGVYLQDTTSMFLGKIFTNPLSPLAVLQQQLINIAGNGSLVESWSKPLRHTP